MGKATVTIPLVTLRPAPDGSYRPRYIPGKRHRRLGLKGEDLRHPPFDAKGRPIGDWFTLDEAARWAEERQRLVDQLSAASNGKARRAVVRRAAGGSIALSGLAESFFQDPRQKGQAAVEGRRRREPLAAATVRYYRNAANQLEGLDDGRIWEAPAAAITPKVLRGVLHRIEVRHGLATARAVRAFMSVLYGWGRAKGMVASNPARDLDENLPMPAPRLRYGSIAEMKALIAAADAIGRPEVGDAIALGLWTGQRQGDRLTLSDGQVTADGILFRQGKKGGQPLLIPAAPELAARLAAARHRRRDWRVNYPHVVLDEVTRRPFEADWYRKVFREVRAEAVKALPSLADFRDQDLRDTAVTWLALASCSKIEIASITGHSLASIDNILKHYLGLHPELARSAIGKLMDWHEQHGEG